ADAGFEVIPAGDGNEGLRLFTEMPFDLVICDVLMPNKDGLETMRDIRRISARLPIITMTGGVLADSEDGRDDLRMSMAFGATRPTANPCRPTVLHSPVRPGLDGRAG